MVPRVGGEWGEVKLLSVGVPEAAGDREGAWCGPALAYFARLADAQTFATQALVELHRSGAGWTQARRAAQDGAPWVQGFVDYHRPDALRILDWPHAAQHLSALAQALFGEGTPRAARVGERLRRWLWADGPDRRAGHPGWLAARPGRPGERGGVFARAACAAGLPRLPCGRMAGGQRGDEERPQAGDAGPHEAGGHALDPPASCQPAAGPLAPPTH